MHYFLLSEDERDIIGKAKDAQRFLFAMYRKLFADSETIFHKTGQIDIFVIF